MTIKTRSNLNLFLLIFSCLFLGLYLAFFLYQAITDNFIFPEVFLKKQRSDNILIGYNPIVVVCCIMIELLYSIIASIVLHRSFAKTQSSIVIFFLFYIFAMFLDTIRIWIPLFHISNSYSQSLILIGNISLFARITAPLALLSTALLHFDEQHQNINKYALILFFISLTLALIIPINTTKILPNFSVSHGYTRTLHISSILLFIASILTLVICNINNDKNQITTIGFCLICCGTEITFKSDRLILFIIANLMLGVGTTLYLTNLHNDYLMN